MSVDLKPCPFCGGDAERIEFGLGAGDNEGGSCVACTECGSSGPVEFGFKENFVSTWNTRAPQWLPIESAPRDGTTIIGFSAAVGEPMLVRFIAPHEFLTTGECEMQMNVSDDADLKAAEDWLNTEAWFYADFSAGDICDSACQPTHWQPLPSPPEVQP